MTIIPWSKGKQVVGENSGKKRKRADKTGSTSGATRKRKNSGGVLRFIEDAAYEVDEDEDTDDDSLFGEDFLEDEFTALVKFEDIPGKAHYFPFGYDEGELSGEELEKLVEERYKPSSSFLTYAEGEYESRRLEAGLAVVTYEPGGLVADAIAPSSEDPTIWKVKCAVGRERLSALCLMQKYVDLQSLGTKLNVISAFVVERARGFIYIEAERQFDIVEACKGIFSVYSSCAAPVPKNKVSRLLSMQSKCNDVSVGSWVRMKNGKYKGDLAEVIAVNEAREKATVKLIPRIDLQAMARKFGGGIASKKSATPAPRLINSTELEEFRPLIQYMRDRDTGQVFEVLDGMKLKDGYLYKKVSISSLMFWGLMPSEEELLKFEPNKKEDSDCQEWLSELYGEQEEKRIIKSEIGGSKGEGSPTCTFEVHDPVLFNRKDFGVIVGTVEDDSFKILKEGSEGPDAVTVNQKHLKKGSFAKKFTTLDRCLKTISINDTVRVSEGPLQGRQGIVKQIFRGTIFLYDENELENSGYICCKSQLCEKIETGDDACNEKVGDESSSAMVSGFLLSSKSPLSSKKPMQTRGNTSTSNRESKRGNFSIGQSLRIKVGPMKGYLCRVLAVYRSDITVKLDSHREILRVKCEHLSQVHGESSAVSLGEDAEPVQPIGLLGTKNSSRGRKLWSGNSITGKKMWRWSTVYSKLQCETYFANTRNSVNNDANKAAANRSCKESFSGTKTAWNCSLTEPKNQTGGPPWSKQTHLNKQVQTAERTVKNYSSGNNPFSGSKVGGWNKNGMGNYGDSTFPQNSWDVTGRFVVGPGSGGRRGRGGVRGGRNQFGRGRTSSMNPFSWNGGEDKGGYGGRGGLNKIGGNFGGRGQSSWRGRGGGARYDRGGFRGRGKLERGGGLGGRGLGTRNQNGEWSNKHNLAFGGGENERSSRGGFSRGGGRSQRGGFGGRGRSDQGNASGIGVGASGWNRQVSAQTNQGWVWNTGKELGKGGASGSWNLSNEVRGAVDPRGKAAAGSSGKGYGGGGKAVW
ncbi:hypothetical protein RHSIM_Rhsim09G0146800 [Rhododendron simsii]|uniref:KOW domain-containing protein n=1 Tax=Rhododendron simsii TaxID=118357 RepID=A0A834GCN9_RHOSS|nr:hypothetical protein RHSIM_Rhsim09G0146800 [Rhododendron simsii]